MTLLSFTLVLLMAVCLAVWLLTIWVRSRCKRDFLEISPRYRCFFRQLGLTKAADFLALPGKTPHIVSGHPDRNVARITFVTEDEQWNAFLKQEHRVSWRTRVGNAVAGFGLSSRSVREARLLQTLEREGQPGPEWLAAGEDGQGRAFLLVRETPGRELRAVLVAEKDSGQRRRIARRLGAALARLHTAGFHHPDLYAHHLFIDRHKDVIHLIDWQRACLRQKLSWRQRRRGLAVLHATVADALASAEERLLFLRAYRRNSSPLGVSWQTAVQEIEAQARRLLKRRHIREKRQPPAPPQAWICLDDVSVTPLLQQHCGERLPDYLLPGNEGDIGLPLQRRWPTLPDATRALLVQRKLSKAQTNRCSRGSLVLPEQRQAALLLRLQRHNIDAPQVLALGQRRDAAGGMVSFLLTEPLADTCSLEAWLAYRTRRRTEATEAKRCYAVLRQAGALLRRLHEANCYLAFGPAGCGLAVRQTGGQPTVVLDNVDGLTPYRRQQPRRAARDLWRMQQMLRWAGCSRSDLSRFRAGYGSSAPPSSHRASYLPATPLRAERGLGLPCGLLEGCGRDSLWRRVLLGICRWRQQRDWPRFAGSDWTDYILDVAVTDRFHAKQGRSTGRWVLSDPAQKGAPRLSVYLKRHYELPWWQGWLATLWPGRNWSPAWKEWQQLEWACRQGLPVPRALAVAEYLGPWGKLRSVLAVEELAGMVSLQQAIPLAALHQDARSFQRWKRSLAIEMARLTRILHDRRCFHKDLYLCHFFIALQDTYNIPAEGWRGRLYLIDLHRLKHHPLTGYLWKTKDIAQILYSSDIVGIDARDRLAFWRAYCSYGPLRARYLGTRWLILYRWRRYRRHNARNRPRQQEGPAGT